MANDIKLEAYSFGIRKRQSDDYLPLSHLFNGESFIKFFQDYLKFIETGIQKDSYKALTLENNSLDISMQANTISGVFRSGQYGYEGDIVNLDNGMIDFVKTKQHSELLPFYFLIYIPNRKRGILLLQRFGIFGIQTIFRLTIQKYLASLQEDLIIDFFPVVSQELAETFVNDGKIRELSFRKYNLPPDIIDRLGMSDYDEDILSIELRITAKRKHYFSGMNRKIKSFVNDKNSKFFAIPELRNLGFDGNHQIKVKSSLNGNNRTIDLSDTGQIRPYYDISDVKRNAKGHPDFNHINNTAKELLQELLHERIDSISEL